MMAVPMSVVPGTYGPPNPSAVDQIKSDKSMPSVFDRLLKRPKIKPIARAVSPRATRWAKQNGLILTTESHKVIQAWMAAGWPSRALER